MANSWQEGDCISIPGGTLFASALSHLRHHVRFYGCALLAAAVLIFANEVPAPLRFIAAGDVFFAIYLALVGWLVFHLTPDDLRRRACDEDEGIFLVVVIVLAIIALSCVGIVTILSQAHRHSALTLTLAVVCAPLGWLSLHTIAAFHYANLYYAPPPEDAGGSIVPVLLFPGGRKPGIWDFLYYSFVVGMTAQVSNVQVTDTRMRRATLGHGVISFFFNTVLIAMAVNAVIAIAA